MSIGENIKKLRESRGMSQKELAAVAGVTDKAVSTWETGANIPRMGAIQKIADYFGIKKSEIIDEKTRTGDIAEDFIVKDGKVLVYGDLPKEAQSELESFFQFLRQKHNI